MHPEQGTNDTMSKLVGALILELADDVPDMPGLESVRADLFAAAKVYESGKKKDLALRFYLATRSLFHELERLEKIEAAHTAGQEHHKGTGGSHENQPPPAQPHEGHHQQN